MAILDRPADSQPSSPEIPTPPNAAETTGISRLGLLYGRLIYRARWLIIALWLAGVAASIPFAATVETVLSGGGYQINGSESAQVSSTMTSKLGVAASSVIVVLRSSHAQVSDHAYQQEIALLTAKLQGFPHVTSVVPGPVSQDERTTFLTVNFDRSSDRVQQHFSDLRQLIPTGNAAAPAQIYLAGTAATYDEFTHLSTAEAEQADLRVLPIALVILLVIFGTLIAACMPLMLAGVTVSVALAGVYAIALHTTMNSIVTVLATIFGLGLSIDYSLFMVRRFREELANGRSVQDAVGWMVATSGEAILFSALTVMIGFLGMLLIGVQFMTSLGVGGALVVLVAMLAALTLLPAVLAVLGQRVNAGRIPIISRFIVPTKQTSRRSGFWSRLAYGVMRFPIPIIIGIVAILAALGWPLFSLRLGLPTVSALPTSSQARQGLDILHQQFPATAQDPIYIIASSPDSSAILTAGNLVKIDHITAWLGEQAHITGVTDLVSLPPSSQPALSTQRLIALYTSGAYQQNPTLAQLVTSTTNGSMTLITVYSNASPDSQASVQLIRNLRDNAAQGQGLHIQVGGYQASSIDFTNHLFGNFPRTIVFILLATFVLLLVMFHSVLLPLKAVIVNLLSIGASYGVLIIVFQWGALQNVLGFTSEGFVESPIPILMFCILFGLSMDYEVFLLSRVREEWLRTQNNRTAVARGLEMTGSVITNAALLLVIVAGAIAFTSLITTKEIGLGIAVAVFVDATIIRTLLVPATMRLIGRWNWWLPGRPTPQERHETSDPNGSSGKVVA
jgi:RND superfamily putative drug exporter